MFSIVATIEILLVIVWIAEAFVMGRARLMKAASNINDLESDQAKFALESPLWIKGLHGLFLALMIPLVIYAIRESADFALVLIIAALIGLFVAILDHFLIKPYRKPLVAWVEKNHSPDSDLALLAQTEPTIIDYSKSFYPVLLLVLFLRSFTYEPFQIPSGSMYPTLEVGDFVVVNKWAYGLRLPVTNTEILDLGAPKAGEIIVFKPPHEDLFYIKRVIGVPGDKVKYDFAARKIFINDEEIDSDFQEKTSYTDRFGREVKVKHYFETIGGIEHEIYKNDSGPSLPGLKEIAQGIVIPEGYYFAMGDNRDNSSDGRYWGFVEEDKISGRAEAIWMHFNWGSLPSFNRVGSLYK